MDQQGNGWLLQLLRNHRQHSDVLGICVQSQENVVLLAEQEKSEEKLHLAAVCGHVESVSSEISKDQVQYLYRQDSILTTT